MPENATLYDTLGVSPQATVEELKKAHRKAMRAYHPDVYDGPAGEAERIAAQVNDAYTTLSDPQRRERYDASLRGEPAAEEPQEGPQEPYEDTWGTEGGWEDVLDEDVVEEPTVTPPPPGGAPSRGNGQGSTPASSATQVRVTTPLTAVRPALLVALGGVLLGFLIAALTPPVEGYPPAMVFGTGLVGALVGLFTALPSKKKPTPPMSKNPLGKAITVVVVSLVFCALLLGFNAKAGGLVAMASSFLGARYCVRALVLRSVLNRVVSPTSLRDNNLFGTPAGGAGPDLLNRSLAPLCGTPTVRVMRNQNPNGVFSHAVLNGNRVAFVKSVVAPSGSYRWSGPSLLRDPAGAHGMSIPDEILQAPYPQFAMNAATSTPANAQIGMWLFVYSRDGGSIVCPEREATHPAVVDPQTGVAEIARFLATPDGEQPHVDQEMFVRSFTALLS